MSHLASVLLRKWCRFLLHNQNLLSSSASCFLLSQCYDVEVSHRLNGLQVSAVPVTVVAELHVSGMSLDERFTPDISSNHNKKKSSWKLLGISIYEPLVMLREWLFTSLLTEWFLVIMHENRIWNERYYTVCIHLLSFFSMEDWFQKQLDHKHYCYRPLKECVWENVHI